MKFSTKKKYMKGNNGTVKNGPNNDQDNIKGNRGGDGGGDSRSSSNSIWIYMCII